MLAQRRALLGAEGTVLGLRCVLLSRCKQPSTRGACPSTTTRWMQRRSKTAEEGRENREEAILLRHKKPEPSGSAHSGSAPPVELGIPYWHNAQKSYIFGLCPMTYLVCRTAFRQKDITRGRCGEAPASMCLCVTTRAAQLRDGLPVRGPRALARATAPRLLVRRCGRPACNAPCTRPRRRRVGHRCYHRRRLRRRRHCCHRRHRRCRREKLSSGRAAVDSSACERSG